MWRPGPPSRRDPDAEKDGVGGFVDLELRFAGDPPLLVWVKHGADLHDQQIESYATDILAAHSSGSCVRLCLDEHYSKEIASQLRDRGRDVDCVKERPELVSVSDQQLWAQMQDEHRALLTENVGDFMPLITASAQAGETHSGIVFSNPRSMPRGRGTIGAFVESVLERA